MKLKISYLFWDSVDLQNEIKSQEYRVGLTPESISELVADGHELWVETKAGEGIGAMDADYKEAGAKVKATAAEIFEACDMIVKVKEPQAVERAMLRPGQILYTYLHLAPDPEQTKELIESGAVCIAYETVTDESGELPLLKPMSQVAGRLATQVGATALQKLGGGQVMEKLSYEFGNRAQVRRSTPDVLAKLLRSADLVIGAVLIPGAAAPKLITREMLSLMKEGSVLVDVAIDQGGCFETSKPTTHAKPTYIVDGVVHYCVANMPGAVARTSAYALNAATLYYAKRIANKGWKAAMRDDPHLLNGLNVCEGKLTYKAVAEAQNLDWVEPASVL